MREILDKRKDMKQNEFQFWRMLAVIFAIPALPCLLWPPARFGAAFFGALAVGCAGEAAAVRWSPDSIAARRVAVLGRILFALFLISFIIIQGIILSGCRPDPEAENADYVLVLGAQIYADRPSASLQSRLDAAFDYLQRNPTARAILCGGQGSNEVMPEAWMMRDYLLAHGVPEQRLLIEDQSSNTIQNIANAYQQYLSPGDRTAVITYEFHLSRARRLMSSAGLDPYGIPSPTPYVSVRIIQHLREYCSVLGLIVSGRWF